MKSNIHTSRIKSEVREVDQFMLQYEIMVTYSNQKIPERISYQAPLGPFLTSYYKLQKAPIHTSRMHLWYEKQSNQFMAQEAIITYSNQDYSERINYQVPRGLFLITDYDLQTGGYNSSEIHNNERTLKGIT